MSNTSKKEYLKKIRPQYLRAIRRHKQTILDEVCLVCDYNRKYAIRLLNAKAPPHTSQKSQKRGRKRQYHHPYILKVLLDIWTHSNLPCAKRLKAIVILWLPYYDKVILPEDIKQKLLRHLTGYHRPPHGASQSKVH